MIAVNQHLGIPTALSVAEANQLQELAQGQLVLELGAHYGASTIMLARTAAVVHSVDWHAGDRQAGNGDTLPSYWENLRRHGASNVITHVGRFEDVLPLFRPQSFDGCFLDGEHMRESLERDTELLWPLVRRSGWVAWHDYGRFEVADWLDPWLAERRLTAKVVEHLAWTLRS